MLSQARINLSPGGTPIVHETDAPRIQVQKLEE